MKKLKLSQIKKVSNSKRIRSIDKKIKDFVESDSSFTRGRKKPRDPEKEAILNSFQNK
ncbi:MAG: hypothetical protein PHD83_01045 [Caldisericia bacterium]|nr:hypothetical protein [Caldisericia bacterium]